MIVLHLFHNKSIFSIMPSPGDAASSMHGSRDVMNVQLGGANATRAMNPNMNQRLSHVAQIGNNTGSLPSEKLL